MRPAGRSVRSLQSRDPQVRLLLLPGMDGTGDLYEPLIEALSLPAYVVSYPTDELALRPDARVSLRT